LSFSSSERKEAAALALGWFRRNARPLPWREGRDPYKILVSEFMLQQTRVETALPYFTRWVKRYPDLASLARADEADVEKLWEGLGYYSRCRSLLAAARAMTQEGLDKPPPSTEALLRYPGIGPYTAGAVASIAYNLPVPAVDGNVERVTSRLLNLTEPAGSPALKRLASKSVLAMMPKGEACDFNQALMELGALVCLPKLPACLECPWGALCLARKLGVQTQRPLTRPRPVVEKISAWGALFFYEDFCLLRRRPREGLWSGLWEVPWFPREGEDALAEVGAWARAVGIECLSCRELGVARFSFTRYRVTAWVAACETALSPVFREKTSLGEWGLHTPDALERVTLPAPSRKFLALLK
jgi:A/G-specific adenine glycosylase